MWSIECLQFSTTLNDPYPHFKVTSLFDPEYLGNGTRYRYSYNGNGIVIGTYTCPTLGVISNDLSDLAKYSMTRSILRPFCDSWASCLILEKITQCRIRNKSYHFTSGNSDRKCNIISHKKTQNWVCTCSTTVKKTKISNQSAICCIHVHLLNNGA